MVRVAASSSAVPASAAGLRLARVRVVHLDGRSFDPQPQTRFPRTRWATSMRCAGRGPNSLTASSGIRTGASHQRDAFSSTRPSRDPSTRSTKCALKRPTRYGFFFDSM
jgi:hypothetical protein